MMVTTSRADSKQLKRAAKPVSTTSTTSTAAAPPSTVASPVNEGNHRLPTNWADFLLTFIEEAQV